MEQNRFDELTRAFAIRTNRRKMIRGLVAFGAGSIVASAAHFPAEAARRGYSGPIRSNLTPGEPCVTNADCSYRLECSSDSICACPTTGCAAIYGSQCYWYDASTGCWVTASSAGKPEPTPFSCMVANHGSHPECPHGNCFKWSSFSC